MRDSISNTANNATMCVALALINGGDQGGDARILVDIQERQPSRRFRWPNAAGKPAMNRSPKRGFPSTRLRHVGKGLRSMFSCPQEHLIGSRAPLPWSLAPSPWPCLLESLIRRNSAGWLHPVQGDGLGDRARFSPTGRGPAAGDQPWPPTARRCLITVPAGGRKWRRWVGPWNPWLRLAAL